MRNLSLKTKKIQSCIQMEEQADFSVVAIGWKVGPKQVEEQYQRLRANIEGHNPDCVVIIGIPRHHAKKVGQQDWTKDYFLSKERTNVTSRRPVTRGAPITLIYSRYPFTSEEWISPADATASEEDSTASDITHVAEVCIPIGAWKPHCSPLDLLQEYQLKYDEVATFTIVALTEPSQISVLKDVFNVEKLNNSVIYVCPPLEGSDGTKMNDTDVYIELCWWRALRNDDSVINLVSDLTISNKNHCV